MTRQEAIEVFKHTIGYESDFAEAKQMAIEALEKELNEDCSDYYKGYCARYEDGCFYQCAEQSRKEDEWIPCSERLPHAEYGESDNVLVTCESKYIRMLYFNGGNWCYPTGEYYEHRIDKVVAWMPLPEPWKGVDNESL